MKKFFKINNTLILVLLLAILIFGWLTLNIIYPGFSGFKINFAEASHYGNLLAGLFSFISVILIAFTLKHQSDTAKLSRFEDHFFQLLKIQRDNSQSISIDQIPGRKVFDSMLKEFRLALEIVKDFSVKPPKESAKGKKEREKKEINIAYFAFFYGIQKKKPEQIFCKILNKYPDIKQKENDLINEFQKRKNRGVYTYFEGHQAELGHYFRHLFQSINFVNKQEKSFLNYDRKCKYVELLHAQLSTQEQMLLFFNSISELGKMWELGKDRINSQLITKYNLLTNIADPEIYDVKIRDYYKLLIFEKEIDTDQKIIEERKELRKKYH